jgi:tripartite ATP-independent transporter DctM subunit
VSIAIITVLMFTSMMLLLLTGRQIFMIIAAVGTISALALYGKGASNMAFFGGYAFMGWYPLIALPPFVLMGLTLARSGIADRLFQAIYLWMGGIRGGLAMGDVGFSCLVSMMSGTNVASTVTSGTISLPAMLKRKYDKRLAVGVVLAGGGLGFLIPPSVNFILYGVIARVSIGHLWLAGILPGFLLASMYIAYISIRCRFQPNLGPPVPPEERVGWGGKFRALGAGISPLILIFIVLGLLFMGVTTLLECSAIGAVGALAIAAIYRRLSWPLFKEICDETLKTTTLILWIFMAALTFSAVFDGLGATHAVEQILYSIGGGPLMIIVVMQLTFVLMGMVLDDTAMLFIVAPLYIPIVAKLGFSLVWYGVLYIVNCQMAILTPPFGFTLFILKGVAPKEVTMTDIYRSVWPFVVIQAVALAVIIVFPQIALWLPSIFFRGASGM